jgi:hypothetical protein
MTENGEQPAFYSTAAAEAAHQELLMAFAGMEAPAAACRRAAAAVEAHLRGGAPAHSH